MRKTLLTTGALAALLVAPAFAQDANAPATTDQPAATDTMPAPDATAPDAMAPDTMAPDAMAPADSTAPAATADSTTNMMADQPRFMTLQADAQMLASNLIGQTVYNAAGESLGDVNDILIDDVDADTGSVVAVIVGVGGFLGIGEKNVAISFNALTETTDADGNVMIVLDTTADELNAAPAFTTAAEADAGAAVEPAPAPAPADPAPAMDAAPAPAEPAPAQ